MRIEFDLDPRLTIRTLLLIVAGLAAASLIGQFSTYFLGDGHLWGFVPQFNLDREMNVPTWFSSFLFLFAALLLWQLGARGGPGRRFATRWKALSIIFVLLSIDEAAAFHEMAVDPIRKALHASGFLYFSWVVAGLLFCIILTLIYWKLVFSLPPKTKALFIGAAALFIMGSLGMEMIGGRYVELHGASHFAYALVANAEEVLEMLGQVTFIQGLFSLFP